MKISKKEFLILQINDSLFPIGSYSHSYGLETYIQKGIVHDEKTAERYLRMKLRYSFMYTDLLAVKLSYGSIQDSGGDSLCIKKTGKSFCENSVLYGFFLETGNL